MSSNDRSSGERSPNQGQRPPKRSIFDQTSSKFSQKPLLSSKSSSFGKGPEPRKSLSNASERPDRVNDPSVKMNRTEFDDNRPGSATNTPTGVKEAKMGEHNKPPTKDVPSNANERIPEPKKSEILVKPEATAISESVVKKGNGPKNEDSNVKTKTTSLSNYLKKKKEQVSEVQDSHKNEEVKIKDEKKPSSVTKDIPVPTSEPRKTEPQDGILVSTTQKTAQVEKVAKEDKDSIHKKDDSRKSTAEDLYQEAKPLEKPSTSTITTSKNENQSEIHGKGTNSRPSITDIDPTTSPLSTLSSELTSLPSSAVQSTDPQRPSRIIWDDDDEPLSDVDETPEDRKSAKKISRPDDIADDSDAETVHGDSPPRSRPGRFVRKYDLDRESSEKRVESTDREDSDAHKRIIYERLDRRNQSKSSSPKRLPSKKLKTTRDSLGRLKLQKICEKGDYSKAKELIEQGADVNDTDFAGTSALHEAALNGHADCVELLLENGANVNMQSGPSDLDTPLMDAVSSGEDSKTQIIEILLKHGADPTIQNTDGDNAFDAIDNDDDDASYLKTIMRDAYEKLKERKKDSLSMNSGAHNHEDFLKVATKEGRSELYCKSLLGDSVFVGQYLQMGGKPDNSSLNVAAKYGNYDVVSMLLAFITKKDSADAEGVTLLMKTVGKGHVDVVRLLLQSGLDVSLRTKDGRSVIDFATDGLVIDKEEIDLINKAISDSGKKIEPITNNKKRKISGNVEASEGERPKHKHPKHAGRTVSEGREKERAKQKSRNHEKEGTIRRDKSRDYSQEFDRVKHREMPKAKASHSETFGKNNSEAKGLNAPKSESMRKTSSSSNFSSDLKEEEPSVEVEKLESEEEKQKRKHKEQEEKKKQEALEAARAIERKVIEQRKEEERQRKEEERQRAHEKAVEQKRQEAILEKKKREAFEAVKAAKRKAREQEFLSNFETEEKKKEEELRKLAELQDERRMKEVKESEARAKLEEEKKIIMSQYEETERRRKVRESYPYGLQRATFDSNRSKEDVLKYVPLYYIKKDDNFYCCDLQVILMLGVENFYVRFPDLFTSKIDFTQDEKMRFFNCAYPFLGNFQVKSTDKQMENFNEDLKKFVNLKLNWIKYDDVMKIIKESFETLYGVVSNRTQQVDFGDISEAPASASSSVEPVSKSEEASPEKLEKNSLPRSLRNRHSVEKILLRNRKLW